MRQAIVWSKNQDTLGENDRVYVINQVLIFGSLPEIRTLIKTYGQDGVKEVFLHKPLILRGAGQVGKTSIVRKFGSENFDQVIEINLEKKDQLSLFDQATSVDDFLKRLSLFFDKKVIPGTSLLFIQLNF